MDKPKSEIIDRIISIIEDRREMELAVKELKEKANSLVIELSNENNKLEIAAYLYWVYPEIRAKELSEAIINQNNIHKFLNTIHSVTANISCDRCNNLIEIQSRTQLKEEAQRKNSESSRWAEGFNILCKICQSEIMQTRHIQYREQEKAVTTRLNSLRSMPYKEYLQTIEWKERRKKHLKSSGYRCQVCNSPEKPLDVHHRTYERRGQEYYKDLIVLCRSCHGTFHENGKLVY